MNNRKTDTRLNQIRSLIDKLNDIDQLTPDQVEAKKKALILLVANCTKEDIQKEFLEQLQNFYKNKASIEAAIKVRQNIVGFDQLEDLSKTVDMDFESHRVTARLRQYFEMTENEMPEQREAIIIDAVLFAAISNLMKKYQLSIVEFININSQNSKIFDLTGIKGLAEVTEMFCVDVLRELKSKGFEMRLDDPVSDHKFNSAFLNAVANKKLVLEQAASALAPIKQDNSIFTRIKQGAVNTYNSIKSWSKKHPNITFALKLIGSALVIGLVVGLAFAFLPPLVPVGIAGAKFIAGVFGIKSIAVISGVGLHAHFGALIGLTVLGVASFGTALGSIAFAIERLIFGGKKKAPTSKKPAATDSLDEVVVENGLDASPNGMQHVSPEPDSEEERRLTGADKTLGSRSRSSTASILVATSDDEGYSSDSSSTVEITPPAQGSADASALVVESDNEEDGVFFSISDEDAKKLLSDDPTSPSAPHRYPGQSH